MPLSTLLPHSLDSKVIDSYHSRPEDNIRNILNDDTLNDVIFVVGSGDDIREIHGNRMIFAINCKVFKNMLYGKFREKVDTKIYLKDITPDAFQFIKLTFYLFKPKLTMDIVVDVLYATEIYLLHAIKTQCIQYIFEQCKHSYLIKLIQHFNKLPSLPIFVSIFCELIQSKSLDEMQDILNNASSYILNVFQIQCIIRIHFNKYPLIAYNVAKNYCINISKNKTNWWSIMRQHFIESINFTDLAMNILVNDIKNDNIFSDAELLKIIRYKVTNNDKIFRMSHCILTPQQLNDLKPGDKIDYFCHCQFWDSGIIQSINIKRKYAMVTSEEYWPNTQHCIEIECNKIAKYHSMQSRGQHCLECFKNMKINDKVLVNYRYLCNLSYPNKWMMAIIKQIQIENKFCDSYWVQVDPVYENNNQCIFITTDYKFYLNSIDEIQPIH